VAAHRESKDAFGPDGCGSAKAPMALGTVGLPCNHGRPEVFLSGPGKITKVMTLFKKSIIRLLARLASVKLGLG